MQHDLALNNPQGLICHKTHPNQIMIWIRIDQTFLYEVLMNICGIIRRLYLTKKKN